MKVRIFDKKFIPTLGKGPFLKPIEVSDQVYRTLKIAGYRISKVKDEPVTFDKSNIEEKKVIEEEVIEEETLEEEVTEDTVEETPEVPEEVIEEETLEEEVTEDTVEETHSREEELKEMSVDDLKNILTDMGIAFKYNDRKPTLISLILENE